MFEFISDIPFVSLFIKFMVSSTVLLGAVWVMEKIKLINSPDMAELAWKAAIVASFIALLPASELVSSKLVLESNQTAGFIDRLNNERPLTDFADGAVSTVGRKTKAQQSFSQQTAGAAQSGPAPAPMALAAPTPNARNEQSAIQIKRLEKTKENTLIPNAADDAKTPNEEIPNYGTPTIGVPAFFNPEGDSEAITIKPTFWQSAATLTTKDLAILGWVGLAFLTMGALVLSYYAAVKNLGSRQRVEAESYANKVLRAICVKADIRHVPYLSRSSDIKSPVCLPRREICLPDWAFDDMPEAEFKSLLAHELGHMVRRDPLMLMALQMLSRIFFFQPLFILARKRLTDIAELAADEWAANLAADSRAVANALFICATKIHETRQIQWGLAMAGNKSILKRRVERLISAQSDPFKTTSKIAKSTLVMGVIGLGLGLPSIEFAGAHPNKAPRADYEALVDHEALVRDFGPQHRGMVVTGDEYVSALGDTVSAMVSHAMSVAASAVESTSSQHEIYALPDFDKEKGNISWHEDDYFLAVKWKGPFQIDDKDETIIAEGDHGSLKLKTNNDGEIHVIKFEGKKGQTTYKYYKDGKQQDLDSNGRKWLKRTIQKLIETGFGAQKRVARILKEKGVKGVLAEIKDFDSDMAKRIYISHTLASENLKNKEIGQVIDVVATMDSDFEKRLTLSQLLDEEKVSDTMLPKVLSIAKKFDSDFEKRLLVTQYVSTLKLTAKSTKAIIEIAETMDSDFELRLMLTAALSDAKLTDKNVERILDLALTKIDSDFEVRLLLSTFVDQLGNSDKAVEKVLAVVTKMDSSFEQRLLLNTLVDQAKMNEKNWLKAIEVATTIDSDHEKSFVLMQMQDEAPKDNKRISTALEQAMAGIDERYSRYEGRGEYKRELADQLREAAQERQEAIREAQQSMRHDQRFIERAQREALRAVKRELARIKRDELRAAGVVRRELARAARDLERAQRTLERNVEKHKKTHKSEEKEVEEQKVEAKTL